MTDLNGQLDESKLVVVTATGEKLSEHTANALHALQAAAARAGVTVKVLRYGAYRNRSLQAAMRREPGLFNVSPGVTQRPVGFSTHGLATSVDMVASSAKKGNARAVAWLLANAPKYGFTQTITGDKNHFQHDGRTAIATKATTATADRIIAKNWTELLHREPSRATLLRFRKSIMTDVDAGTHSLRVYIKGSSAYKRLQGNR